MDSNFVDKIINMLINSELSNYKISQDTGISDETIANYRKGKSKPRGANLAILSKYLDSQSNYITHSGCNTSYTGNFRDVKTHIGNDTTLQGGGNAVGTGNIIEKAKGNNNQLGHTKEGETEISELRYEVERLTSENFQLTETNEFLKKANEELRKSNEELHKALIEEKERVIKILLEKK